MQMIWLSWAWPSKLKSKSVPKRNSSSRCCFELSLLCDAALVVFVVCLGLQHVAAFASVDHTPCRVVHIGGSVEEAASLVTIICLGPFNFAFNNFFFLMSFCFSGSFVARSTSTLYISHVNPLVLSASSTLLQSLTFLSVPFVTSYIQLAVAMFFFGAGQGNCD